MEQGIRPGLPNSRQMLQPLGWPFAPIFKELKRLCPDFRDGSEVIEGGLAKITEKLDQVKMCCLRCTKQSCNISKSNKGFSTGSSGFLAFAHTRTLIHTPSLQLIFLLPRRKDLVKGN